MTCHVLCTWTSKIVGVLRTRLFQIVGSEQVYCSHFQEVLTGVFTRIVLFVHFNVMHILLFQVVINKDNCGFCNAS